MATGADFAVFGVVGHRPMSNRVFDPIFGLIMAYSADPVVRMTVGKVIHMLRPPSDLFVPALLGRAALNIVRGVAKRKPADSSYPAMPAGAMGQRNSRVVCYDSISDPAIERYSR